MLDDRRFPVEQHFVHRGPDGQTLVLGLFLAGGGRGGTLQDAVLREMPEECGEEIEVSGDLAAALPSDLSTFRYDGSLTTAPVHRGRLLAGAEAARAGGPGDRRAPPGFLPGRQLA